MHRHFGMAIPSRNRPNDRKVLDCGSLPPLSNGMPEPKRRRAAYVKMQAHYAWFCSFAPFYSFCQNLRASASLRFKNTILPNEPKLKITKHCQSIGCKKSVWLRFQNEPIFPGSLRFKHFPFKVSQALSRLFKGIQPHSRFFWEKLFFGKGRRARSTRVWHAPCFGQCLRRGGFQGVPNRSKAFSRKKRLFIFFRERPVQHCRQINDDSQINPKANQRPTDANQKMNQTGKVRDQKPFKKDAVREQIDSTASKKKRLAPRSRSSQFYAN